MTDELIRTPAKAKAQQLLKYLRRERPDYGYLREVFRQLRTEMNIKVDKAARKLPYVPSEDEILSFYNAVWKSKKITHIIILKTFLYTGVRVSELVNIKLKDVDIEQCQARINNGKGGKDRIVPFPKTFKEALAIHVEKMAAAKAVYLFESSWKKKYTDRGIRKILAAYSERAGFKQNISPHTLRHFFLKWLKKQGVDDALIQPYSGHETRQSLEVYSHLTIKEAQEKYNSVIKEFPI
jgi:integrase/recombinase XerD